MKKALINDWYYVNGGAEKVIRSFNNIWDDFEHYALIDYLNDSDRDFILKGKKANVSFIQNLPTVKSNHRKFLQLFPYAIEQFDLREYDLILSSSASVAKGVLVDSNQLHICYCHSPMRYAWDLYHQYLKEQGLISGLKSIYARYVLHKIRNWDVLTANRVDHFIANSHYIAKRIKKIYNRDSVVIYPPVDVDFFSIGENKEDYYFSSSRMVPYKKMQLIVEAFNKMPHRKLIMAGTGSEFEKIKRIAKSNITLLGYVAREDLKYYMQKSKGFVFASEEDFGISPVEAQACGTPVIAYGKGGVLETVIENETGVFFKNQTVESLIDAVDRFEKMRFNSTIIRDNAMRFSTERFEVEMKDYVESKWKEYVKNRDFI